MNDKVGIIVPYRNRNQHLEKFIPKIKHFCQTKGQAFLIVIVEQEEGKEFNRGKLINIGFVNAKKEGVSHIITHDVDIIPDSLSLDYSCPPTVKHLCGVFHSLGGIVSIPNELFIKMNGFSNNYWGWGREDVDFKMRAEMHAVAIDKTDVSQIGRKENDEVQGKFLCLAHLPAWHSKTEQVNVSKWVEASPNGRYLAKVKEDPQLLLIDGLNSLEYTLLKSTCEDHVLHILVSV